MPQVKFHFGQGKAGEQYREWAARVNRQPSWIARVAMMVVGLIILVPILLVVLTAIIAGLVVFLILSLLNGIAGIFGGGSGGGMQKEKDDGRENVRVIYPDEQ